MSGIPRVSVDYNGRIHHIVIPHSLHDAGVLEVERSGQIKIRPSIHPYYESVTNR